MNPFKAIGRALASPVTETKDAVQLVKTERKADAVIDVLNDAKSQSVAGKSIYKSKVFWFNLLTAIAGLLGVLPVPPQYLIPALGLINIGLRVITTGPVGALGVIQSFLAAAAKDKVPGDSRPTADE